MDLLLSFPAGLLHPHNMPVYPGALRFGPWLRHNLEKHPLIVCEDGSLLGPIPFDTDNPLARATVR
jgi:hypothetical protein